MVASLARGGSGRGDRLAFFNQVHDGQFERHSAGVVRFVLRAIWNHEAVAGFDLERRFAFHLDLAFAFHDVTDFLAGMGVPPGASPYSNLGAHDYRFTARSGDIRAGDDSSLRAGGLGK